MLNAEEGNEERPAQEDELVSVLTNEGGCIQSVDCIHITYSTARKLGGDTTRTKVYLGVSLGLPIAVKLIPIHEEGNDHWVAFKSAIDEMKSLDKKIIEDKPIELSSRKLTALEILRAISHQNIVKILNFAHDDKHIYIPMELCNMNLFQYCFKYPFVVSTRIDILKQIGSGLQYLHGLRNCIIHRDLRPKNILIKFNDIDDFTVKLSDFDISRVVNRDDDSEHCSTDTKGGLYCKPYEVLKGYRKITTAVDIYAFGCLVYSLLKSSKLNNPRDDNLNEDYIPPELDHPFGSFEDRKKLEQNVKNGERQNRLNDKKNPSDLLILADLSIDDATNKDFRDRPDIGTFITHPLFWTVRHKEIFLRGINNEHFPKEEETPDFLKDFDDLSKTRFLEKHGNEEMVHWSKECSDFERIITLTYPGDVKYDTTYLNLVRFVRNKCEHFSENKAKFKDCDVFGKNKSEFIENVINHYPYLIHDLFTCFRNKLQDLDYEGAYLHEYFENLIKSECFKRRINDLETLSIDNLIISDESTTEDNTANKNPNIIDTLYAQRQ